VHSTPCLLHTSHLLSPWIDHLRSNACRAPGGTRCSSANPWTPPGRCKRCHWRSGRARRHSPMTRRSGSPKYMKTCEDCTASGSRRSGCGVHASGSRRLGTGECWQAAGGGECGRPRRWGSWAHMNAAAAAQAHCPHYSQFRDERRCLIHKAVPGTITACANLAFPAESLQQQLTNIRRLIYVSWHEKTKSSL